MSKKFKEEEKGKLYEMYGHYLRVPHVWYKLCRKYEIPKEVTILKTKDNTITLNPMEVNVLAYLAGYNIDDDKKCYPGNSKLAEVFQVGISTIEKYLKELRWVGFIKTFEEKSSSTYTERRNIYVQFDVIDKVLASENDPYKCMAYSEDNPYECMDKPIQTEGLTHINEWEEPYECMTNKKELKSIKKDYKSEKKNIIYYDDLSDAAKESIYSTIIFTCDYKNNFEKTSAKYKIPREDLKRIYEEGKKQLA